MLNARELHWRSLYLFNVLYLNSSTLEPLERVARRRNDRMVVGLTTTYAISASTGVLISNLDQSEVYNIVC